MPLAIDERYEWRKQLENGEIPEEVEFAILQYKSQRGDSTWRSSKFVELLGEAALYWFETKGGYK